MNAGINDSYQEIVNKATEMLLSIGMVRDEKLIRDYVVLYEHIKAFQSVTKAVDNVLDRLNPASGE